MASLLQPDRVIYLVRGEKKLRAPLSQLYFCRYCSELRSLECVSHEVSISSRWVSPPPKHKTKLLVLDDFPAYFKSVLTCDWLSDLPVMRYCQTLAILLVVTGVCFALIA